MGELEGDYMRKKKSFIAVSAVLAMSTGTTWADTGYFAVANIGDSSADLATSFSPPLSDDDRSFEIGVGYAFNPHLSVQAGYHDFGDFHGELELPCPPNSFCLPPDECPPGTICLAPPPIQVPFRVDVTGWSLRVTGAYPLGERFAAFASAGVLVWDADLRFALEGGTAIFTGFGTEGDDLMYEAGLRWRLSDRWNIQASYEKADLDIESTKLGVLFRF